MKAVTLSAINIDGVVFTGELVGVLFIYRTLLKVAFVTFVLTRCQTVSSIFNEDVTV